MHTSSKSSKPWLKKLGFALLLLAVGGQLTFVYYLKPRLVAVQMTELLYPSELREVYAHWQQQLQEGTGYSHNSGFCLMDFGGKYWMERLIEDRVRPRLSMGCAGAHVELALTEIACTQPKSWGGGRTDGSPFVEKDNSEHDFWLQWWEAHKNESRLEWVRQGLSVHGIPVDQPLSTENWRNLLRKTGKAQNLRKERAANRDIDSPSTPDDLPGFVIRNAFRWIRDCSPLVSTSEMLADTPAAEASEIALGLAHYADWCDTKSQSQCSLHSDHKPSDAEPGNDFDQVIWLLRLPYGFFLIGLLGAILIRQHWGKVTG
jgi:hypothetical protein